MNISTGELTILHQFADMAVEGFTNRRELDEANATGPGLDPVIRYPRHPEQTGCIVLGEP
jgi:hypothetical protein